MAEHKNYNFKEVSNNPASAVFSIDLVVKCIFQHLNKNFQDVKTFRLISPTCNRISLSHFSVNSKINTKRLSVLPARSSGVFVKPDSVKDTLANFTSLDVKGFTSLSSPGVNSFLQIHGGHINHLTLFGPIRTLDIPQFQMLIGDWLPSLRTLIFNSRNLHNSQFENGRRVRTGYRTLQNLKELSFGSDIFKINTLTEMEISILQDILLASPNLECLKIFEPELLDVVLACNKGHLLKELTFYPQILLGDRRTRKYFKHLRRQSPKLREIEFCANTLETDEDVRQLRADVTSCLLTQSKDSLKTLKITFDDSSPGQSFPLQLDLPVFSNVTSMNLADLYLLSYTKPHGSHISEFLPALRHVVVNSRILRSMSKRGYYSIEGPISRKFQEVIPSVKILEIHISSQIRRSLMTKLSEAFTDVETVRFHWSNHHLPGIFWLLPNKVKNIQVWDFPLSYYQDLKLECLLTGSTNDIPLTSHNLEMIENLAIHSPIRKFQNLASVKFYCTDFPFKVPQDGWGYFSNVTKWLLLEPLSELQIHLAFPQVISSQGGISYPTLAELPDFSPVSDGLVISFYDSPAILVEQ